VQDDKASTQTTDHNAIWLAPNCPHKPRACEYPELTDAGAGRLWCEHNVWAQPCPKCGATATRYIRDRRTGGQLR
jgi:hypothetical protein